jgi:hypothetical protein
MARDVKVIWVKRERKYFCARDWTTQIRLNPKENFSLPSFRGGAVTLQSGKHGLHNRVPHFEACYIAVWSLKCARGFIMRRDSSASLAPGPDVNATGPSQHAASAPGKSLVPDDKAADNDDNRDKTNCVVKIRVEN